MHPMSSQCTQCHSLSSMRCTITWYRSSSNHHVTGYRSYHNQHWPIYGPHPCHKHSTGWTCHQCATLIFLMWFFFMAKCRAHRSDGVPHQYRSGCTNFSNNHFNETTSTNFDVLHKFHPVLWLCPKSCLFWAHPLSWCHQHHVICCIVWLAIFFFF